MSNFVAFLQVSATIAAVGSAWFWYKSSTVELPPITEWQIGQVPPAFVDAARYNKYAAGLAAVATGFAAFASVIDLVS